MNRRDLLLDEMQIPQWVLRKPQVLKGDARICLDEAVKLVVICEENYASTPIFADILRAIQLRAEQAYWVNPEQAQRLSISHQPIIWLIAETKQAAPLAKKFANSPAWQNNAWQELSQAQHKRQLWQQIQQYRTAIKQT